MSMSLDDFELGDQLDMAVAVKRAARPPTLRDYQRDVIEQARRALAEGGKRRIIIVAPTGAGKTVIVSQVVENAVGKGKRVLFLVHRRELIKQALEKLADVGLDASVIAPGFEASRRIPVQVASIATLHGRAVRSRQMELPPADLIVVDEMHHAVARTWRSLLDSYPQAYIVGLTATPCRADGLGLGAIFEEIVSCPDVRELINLGYLVPTVVFTHAAPKLDDIKVTAGEYNLGQLGERMNTDVLVGDVVTHWLKYAAGRPTLVYAVDVAHSMHLCNEFNRAGITAGHIDGGTATEERDHILGQLRKGVLDVVCNCGVLTEGFDAPDVSCIVLARPTKSFSLYRQIVGRALRPAKGKAFAMVLDHSGATLEHGFVDEPVTWSLKHKEKAYKRVLGKNSHHKREMAECPECGAARWKGRPCTACGWRGRTASSSVDFVDQELQELERDYQRNKERAPSEARPQRDPEEFYRMLKWIGSERGYAEGWAAHKYREKHQKWPGPTWRWAEPMEPAPDVRSWVRARSIAWAKSRNNPVNQG